MKTTILLLVVVMLFFVGCIREHKTIDSVPFVEIPMEASESREIMVTANGVKYLVNPNKIRSGGPPKDGIPSIDNPKFVSVEVADAWIQDDELVLAIIYKGEERVYPLQILVWHEIVNDVIANDPVLITYCPLCGSGIAYERFLNNQVVEFGTSGKLYNSNLVMYDRLTDTYWSQIDGLAIVGELTGTKLKAISIDTVVWRDWKSSHPSSKVLSQDTGFSRAYGRDPYGSYYENSFVFFPVENEDDSVHPKTVIFGIEIDGTFKAYKEEDLKELKVIEDVVNNIPLKIERSEEGIITITNLNTGEEIVKERDFWFAWYAFHPDTLLYEKLSVATLAGGCFWCMEAFFQETEGVEEVISGFTGGEKENPTYKEVLTGTTGHYEAVQIFFDPEQVSYEEIIELFWKQIDPTDAGGQITDRGSQYRTAILYQNPEQKLVAEKSLKRLNESGTLAKPVVTKILSFSKFYPAEEYHQDYYLKRSFQYNSYKTGSGRERKLKEVWENLE